MNVRKFRADLIYIGLDLSAVDHIVSIIEKVSTMTPSCFSLMTVQLGLDDHLFDKLSTYFDDMGLISCPITLDAFEDDKSFIKSSNLSIQSSITFYGLNGQSLGTVCF